MKNLVLIIALLFCLNSNGQNHFKLKGKFAKNTTWEIDCGSKYPRQVAVVLEIIVTNPDDIKRFGEKLYVAQICPELGNALFDGKEYEIEVLDYKKWNWEVSILNQNLFEKNIDKKVYWLEKTCCRYTTIDCNR